MGITPFCNNFHRVRSVKIRWEPENKRARLAQVSNFEEGLTVETSLRKTKSVKKYEFVIITSGYQFLLRDVFY